MVNDHHEATYFIRAPMPKALSGRYAYTMRFPKDTLPPVAVAWRIRTTS
jgi:hypothetical protein